MDNQVNLRYPKLRPVEARPVVNNGHPSILLRDPLQLSGNYMVLPRNLGPALALFDGTRDVGGIQAAVLVRTGVAIPRELLEYLTAVLDENYMLENERSAAARDRALAAYRAAPFRPPALAGQSYPADPDDLRRLFDALVDQSNGERRTPTVSGTGHGVFSPHIDYRRGGLAYASLWQRASSMARAADLVVLLGTDHSSMGDRLTLTRQHYATPFGVLPTHEAIVDSLAQAIGPEAAFAGELRNRSEHSLELVANWLHYARDGKPVELVPVLTGSFGDFILGHRDPAQDPILNAFLGTLRSHIQGRHVLVVASGDLSHLGPAFGGPPVDLARRQRMTLADKELMEQLSMGNAEGFLEAIRREQDRNNVCGVSPFYLAMRVMGAVEGDVVAYEQCPADEASTSWVSICGLTFG